MPWSSMASSTSAPFASVPTVTTGVLITSLTGVS